MKNKEIALMRKEPTLQTGDLLDHKEIIRDERKETDKHEIYDSYISFPNGYILR